MFTLCSIVTKAHQWCNEKISLLFRAPHFYLQQIKNYSAIKFLDHSCNQSVVGKINMTDSCPQSSTQNIYHATSSYTFYSVAHTYSHLLKHSGQKRVCIQVGWGDEAWAKDTHIVWLQHQVVLPLLLKNLMQILWLLGLMDMYIGMENFPTNGLNTNSRNKIFSRNGPYWRNRLY